MDGTGSGLCPVVGFGINYVEPLNCATGKLVSL
jgi:hypothetical protein